MGSNSSMFFYSIFPFIYGIFMLAMIGISIYSFFLFVKLARRGIKALDIYIEEKSKGNHGF